jgi:hypothetical protein
LRWKRETADNEGKNSGDEVQSVIRTGEIKITLILKTGSVYHVMNSTCIHLRTGGPNIYMYMKGKYTKNPQKE